VLLAPAAAFGQAYSEGLITIPGAYVGHAYGIDDNDQIVGLFTDNHDASHGFVLSEGVVAQIDQPGANVSLLAINSVAGIVVTVWDIVGRRAILDANREVKTIAGSQGKFFTGINASHELIGYKGNTSFVDVNGAYTVVVPGPCQPANGPVVISGVNANGDFVGYCYEEGSDVPIGFARIGGVDQTVSVFGGPTYPMGINDSGTIAGWFVDASSVTHGFILSGSAPTQFDFVRSTAGTEIQGINNRGSVAGITLYVSLRQACVTSADPA